MRIIWYFSGSMFITRICISKSDASLRDSIKNGGKFDQEAIDKMNKIYTVCFKKYGVMKRFF